MCILVQTRSLAFSKRCDSAQPGLTNPNGSLQESAPDILDVNESQMGVDFSLCMTFVCCRSTRGDCREPLPPRDQGLGNYLLLHAGGYHNACHYPGVCAGRKWDKDTELSSSLLETILYCSLLVIFAENQQEEALLQNQTQQVQ